MPNRRGSRPSRYSHSSPDPCSHCGASFTVPAAKSKAAPTASVTAASFALAAFRQAFNAGRDLSDPNMIVIAAAEIGLAWPADSRLIVEEAK